MSILAALASRRRYLSGKGTLEVSGYPWLTVGAIRALEQIIKPNFRILELGSGGSTVFFSRRAAFVRSIETDEVWMNYVDQALMLSGQTNVNLSCASLAEAAHIIEADQDASYDLLLVDHRDPTKSRRPINRLSLTNVALPKLRPECWVVVDNYAICRMQRFNPQGWDVWTFDDLDWAGRGTRIFHRVP